MQRKEQRVVLLGSPLNQDEYMAAQPKRKATSRSSRSKLSKGPMRGTGPQAIAGSATTSTAPNEPRDPGQREHGSYHKADEPTAGLNPVDRTSSSKVDEIPSMMIRKTSQSRMTTTRCL